MYVARSTEIYEVIQQALRPPAKGSRLPLLDALDRKAILFATRRRLNPRCQERIRYRYERPRRVLNDEKQLFYEEPN